MKKSFFVLIAYLMTGLSACREQSTQTDQTAGSDSSTAAPSSDWKLGVQMWTFHEFPFITAIEKTDSAGIKFIEAFPGQPLGGSLKGTFDIDMSAENQKAIRDLLQAKGIQLVAFGVVVPPSMAVWRKTFAFAKEMQIQYITAEPLKAHWDSVNILAGEFGIPIAIHDHPKPSPYDHPDSVIAAMNGRSNIYACADIGHWARNGLDVVACLKQLEGRIYGAHLKDIKIFDKPDAEDTRLGTGVIKFPEVFQELKRQGFKGIFSIENEANWKNNVPDVLYNKKYFEDEISKLK
ncbi:MAG TPA: sugar phosphate isomerase/epimerase [Flavitalea sp.]|nr:sugar phosphate isomerase/epimerase [Flavitalea sp.]